jgi:HPt (histidine-containing phosphotransfer) domain-containing protein
MAERKKPSLTDLAVLDPDGAFIRRLRDDRDALIGLAADLWSAPEHLRSARLTKIEALAHRLAGAAGTFGYSEVGAAALELESRIATPRSDGRSAIDAGLAGLQTALEALVRNV